MSFSTDDSDAMETEPVFVTNNSGKQHYRFKIKFYSLLNTAEVTADKESCNIQWSALHFLAVWYRGVSSPGEGGRMESSIRETIANKLAEVSCVQF